MTTTRYGHKLKTKIYRKPTHTLKYATKRSNRPEIDQLGGLKGLVNRAYRLISADCKEDLEEELTILADAFILGGFDPDRVERIILEYQPKDQTTAMEEKEEENKQVISTNYIPGISEKLRKELKKEGINLVFKRGQTLGGLICNVKQKRPIERKKDVIYYIPCKHCDEPYIGETKRHWGTRKKEHQASVRRKEVDKNGVANHCINKLHHPDWDNCKIIDRDSNNYMRKMKESIYIQAHTGGNDGMRGVMNLDNNYRIDQSWNKVYSAVRESLK